MTTGNVGVRTYKPWQFQPGNPGGPGRPAQLTVQQLLDKATSREEAIAMLLSVARNTDHRDRYRAIERIVSYYFGTPRINVDVTTDSEPAALMRQLWTAMVSGEVDMMPASTDVLDAEGGAVPSAIPPAIDSSQ